MPSAKSRLRQMDLLRYIACRSTVLIALALMLAQAVSPRAAWSLEPERLPTPSDRFETGITKAILKSEFSLVPTGKSQVLIALMTANAECTSAEVLRLGKTGHIERESLKLGSSSFGNDRGGLAKQRLERHELDKLEALLKQLPEADSNPLPVERRLLIAAWSDTGCVQRIYDRAKIPQTLDQILALLLRGKDRATFGALARHIPANSRQTLKRATHQSRFTVSPEGAMVVVAQGGGAVHVFNEELKEVSRFAVVRTSDVFQCSFSNDGKLLALLSGGFEGGSRISILNARSWKRVAELERAHDLSPLLAFSFSSSHNQILLRTKERSFAFNVSDGTILADSLPQDDCFQLSSRDNASRFFIKPDGTPWLARSIDGREICLDKHSRSLKAAFSPNDRLIAVLTISHQDIRLRIWNTHDVTLLSELRPYGLPWLLHSTRQGETILSWSPDSAHLVSASTTDGVLFSRQLHLWDVHTGEHKADLTASYSDLIGTGFGSSEKCFFAASASDIYRWDLTDSVSAKHTTDRWQWQINTRRLNKRSEEMRHFQH
jgi:hypothetical protein